MSTETAARVPDVADVDTTKATFRGPEVCTLTGITYRQLDYWARTGLLVPSIADARGSGSHRVYSRTDVAVAQTLRSLLFESPGSSRLEVARRIEPIVRAHVEAGSDVVLVITADDVLVAESAAELLGIVRHHQSVTVIAGAAS